MSSGKSHNPSLFERLFNIFIRPIVNAVKEILNSTIGYINEVSADEIKSETQIISDEIKTEMEEGTKKHSPMTPAEAISLTSNLRNTQRDHWFQLYILSLLIEGLSLGQVDGPSTMAFQEPQTRASLDLATEWYAAPYKVGINPYVQRYYLSAYTPMIPEPYRLAMIRSKDIIEPKYYDMFMAENGLSQPWALAWAEATYEYPTFQTVAQLYWRGEINIETLNLWLRRSGMRPDVAKSMETFLEVIPPLPDLIRMAVREAFPVPAGQAQFDEMENWAAMQGLNPYWVQRYWLAHFNRMDLTRAYENVWRGYFDMEAFEKYLLLADVHPDDWKSIEAVMFNPPSIREMGYGYDFGAYTKEDIIRYRRWGGLSPEDAEKAATALILYRQSAEREAIRRELLSSYAYDRIDRREFETRLRELDTPEENIWLWLERGDLTRERLLKPELTTDYRIITSSEALWALKHGMRSVEWTRQRLKELDWTDERVQLAIERALDEYVTEEEEAEEAKYRKKTLSQIQALYNAGYLTKDMFRTELQIYGYSPTDAYILAELYTIKDAVAAAEKPYTDAWSRRLFAMRLFDRQALKDNYLALGYDSKHADMLVTSVLVDDIYPMTTELYKKGYIDQQEFLRRLIWVGMEETQALELLERTVEDFQLERLEDERELTKAEIVKGVKNNIITYTDGTRLLERIGYEDWEAEYILEINKVVAAGDPESYWEMRKVVEKFSKAVNKGGVDIPDEVLMLDKMLREQKAKLEKMKEAMASDAELNKAEIELANIKSRLRKVLVSKEIK